MAPIKCTAAGDAMVLRRLPGNYPGFQELRDFISQGDFRFVNLETTIHDHETYGAAQSGGTWFCSPPGVLEDLKDFGFNAVSTCNNHSMDYAHTGLLLTLDYIKKAGLPNAGVGRTLAEAAAPVYLDTMAGRIAYIAACSTFNGCDPAGEQTRSLPGRPGINAIRCKTSYTLPQADIDVLKRISSDLHLNAANEISRKEGYRAALPESVSEFGDMTFEAGEKAQRTTTVHPVDMARVEASIKEALYFADYVVVAMHSHQIAGTDKITPDDFYVEFAHKCIDAGAGAVIGTGPHLLRPLELYKGCPIFYSLGDFICQLENNQIAPADMYEGQNLDPNLRASDLFDKRNCGGTRGLCYQKVMFQTVVPYWEVEDGKLSKLILLPVELNFDQPVRSTGGWPRPKFDEQILQDLAKMSEPYGTKIDIVDGMGIVRL